MAAALILLGAVLLVAGFAIIYWPLAFVAAGVLAVAAGVDLSRS